MLDHITETLLEAVYRDRRDAVAHLIAAAGYAPPQVSSFRMDDLSEFEGVVLAGNMSTSKR